MTAANSESARAAPSRPGRSFDPNSLIGRVFGERYRIDGLLGRGGMSVVYRATEVATKRTVALKVMSASVSEDERQILRFKQEARASSRLTHPSIIRVHDYGQSSDGLLYMAMEILEGRTLGQLIKRDGPLPPKRACRILSDACAALAEAHRLGIIHRDLKPDNIFMVTEERDGQGKDTVKLLDFGIAKVVGEGNYETLTQTGFICGTPLYISPEQSLGQELDGRADLYSAGVILYELLTGRTPFIADTPIALVMKHIHNEPPTFEESNAGVSAPEALRQLCFRLLAKDRNKRPRSSQEVAEVLARLAPACAGLKAAPRVTAGAIIVDSEGTPAAMPMGEATPAAAPLHDDPPISLSKAPEPPRPPAQSGSKPAANKPSGTRPSGDKPSGARQAVDLSQLNTFGTANYQEAPHESTRVLDLRAVETAPEYSPKIRQRPERPKTGNGFLWLSVGVAVLLGGGVVALFAVLEAKRDADIEASRANATPVATVSPTDTREVVRKAEAPTVEPGPAAGAPAAPVRAVEAVSPAAPIPSVAAAPPVRPAAPPSVVAVPAPEIAVAPGPNPEVPPTGASPEVPAVVLAPPVLGRDLDTDTRRERRALATPVKRVRPKVQWKD